MNWLKTLDRLIENPSVGPESQEYLEAQAGGWPTCACGQLCKDLPRYEAGEPKDAILQELGMRFMDFVSEQDWYGAKGVFLQIEKRSAELLADPSLAVDADASDP